MGVVFFSPLLSPPPTGSDLQCSASLLLRRFSQISESCFSSEPAGRQAGSRIFALPSQHPWSSISKDLFRCSFTFLFWGHIFFSFIYYLFFGGSSSSTAGNQTICTTTLAAFLQTFLPSILFFFLLCFVGVFPVDCHSVFLSDGLHRSSGFHWKQIRLWWQ